MTSAASLPTTVRPLPTHRDLPCEDPTVAHNFFDAPQLRLLTDPVEWWLKEERPGLEFLIGEDSYIYWQVTTPATAGAKAPDWFLVPGQSPLLEGDYRRSYVMWNEHIPPLIALEFISETPGGEWDQTPGSGKFWVYEQGIKVPHYAIWDPFTNELHAFVLVHGRYQPAKANERGHYAIESLGLEYGLWHGEWKGNARTWLRFWDNQGNLLLAPEEIAEQERHRIEQLQRQAEQDRLRAEQAQQQAEQDRLRAEQARQQAEQDRLRAEQAQQQAEQDQRRAAQAEQAKRKAFDKLRELGIDPEKLA